MRVGRCAGSTCAAANSKITLSKSSCAAKGSRRWHKECLKRSGMADRTDELQGTYHSPFGQEIAPSEMRKDEPTFARFFGMAGLMLVFAAALIILLHTWLCPRWLTPPWGYFFLILGVASLLFHAARETEIQLRRSYGIFGFGLVAIAVLLAVMPQEGAMGAMFLPWGPVAGLVGLFFLLPFAHNEVDLFWRNSALRTLAVVGGLAALAGFVGGTIAGD